MVFLALHGNLKFFLSPSVPQICLFAGIGTRASGNHFLLEIVQLALKIINNITLYTEIRKRKLFSGKISSNVKSPWL